MTAISWAWDALRKPLASWIVRFAVAAGLIALLAVFVDFPAAIEALGEVSPLLFLAALAVALAAWLVNTLKWRLLLQPLDPGPSLLRLYQWNLRAIFYSQFLPGMLAGEAVKGYRLYRETRAATPVIVSIAADRLTGLVALAPLGGLALIRSPDLRGEELYIGLIGGFGLLMPVLLLALCTPMALGWTRGLKRYPLLAGLARQGGELIQPYQGRYPLLAAALLLATAFHTLNVLVLYVLSRESGVGVSFVDLLWVYAALALVRLMPISLGNLGTREASLVLLLKPLGVPSEAALTLGLLVLGVHLAMALLGGGLELKAAIWPPAAGVAPQGTLIAQSEGIQGWSRDA